MVQNSEVDAAKHTHELKSSSSFLERKLPDFEVLDSKNCECSQDVTDRGFQEASLHGRAKRKNWTLEGKTCHFHDL